MGDFLTWFCFPVLPRWLLQIHIEFVELLTEQKLDSKAQWRKVRSKIEKDPRYKAVDSSVQREDWFKEHTEQLYKVTDDC